MAYGRGHRHGKGLATAASQAWYAETQHAHLRAIEATWAPRNPQSAAEVLLRCDRCRIPLLPAEYVGEEPGCYRNCAACSTSQF